jgi:hypothetical protein
VLIALSAALIVTLTAAAYSVTWDLFVREVEDPEARPERSGSQDMFSANWSQSDRSAPHSAD